MINLQKVLDTLKMRLDSPALTLESLTKSLIDFINDNISLKTPEALLLQYIDIVFNPRLILRHLVVIASLQIVLITSKSIHKLWQKIIWLITSKGKISTYSLLFESSPS